MVDGRWDQIQLNKTLQKLQIGCLQSLGTMKSYPPYQFENPEGLFTVDSSIRAACSLAPRIWPHEISNFRFFLKYIKILNPDTIPI